MSSTAFVDVSKPAIRRCPRSHTRHAPRSPRHASAKAQAVRRSAVREGSSKPAAGCLYPRVDVIEAGERARQLRALAICERRQIGCGVAPRGIRRSQERMVSVVSTTARRRPARRLPWSREGGP
jgi:hypothetical protein